MYFIEIINLFNCLHTANLKTEISTSLSDLTKTNNEKVKDLETKIMRGTIDLWEMSKLITDQIKVVNITLQSLNNKDVLTAEDIKEIH